MGARTPDDLARAHERGSHMSAQDNAETMRTGYAAFSRGDMDALRNELFTADIVWHQGGRNQTSGDYRGVDAVVGLFGKLFQLTDGTFRVEIHDVLASEDHVVVLARATAQRGGKAGKDGNYPHVCQFRYRQPPDAWVVDVDPHEPH